MTAAPGASAEAPPLPVQAPRVKICGVTRPEDAIMARAEGADLLGCVLVSSSPRRVEAEDAARIAGESGLPLVLVMADLSPADAVRAARTAGASILQLHGDEDEETVRSLREAGGWTVWKGVRVQDAVDAARAFRRWGGRVDGLLLDGWSPRGLGGTGTPFPWEGVAPFRRQLLAPTLFIAAGGLTPENVWGAASLLRPDVVDVSSGVESAPGLKDRLRVRRFIGAVRQGPGGRQPLPTDRDP